MKVLAADQIYTADKLTIQNEKISSLELMERAGFEFFKWLKNYISHPDKTIHIFCGKGNNGGDGLVVGRLLIEAGYNPQVYIVDYSNSASEDFSSNLNRFKAIAENRINPIKSENNFPNIGEKDLIIDALFGIGLNRNLEGLLKKLILSLNQSPAFKISVDIPSGLFANAPIRDAEAIFNADLVLTFQVPKLGFFLPESSQFVKEFRVLDIGLDADFIAQAPSLATLVTKEKVQSLYLPRERFGHKGTYGHTLIIGGSYGKIGAAVLSAAAAFRSGAGLVTALTPKCGYAIVQTAIPEAMVLTDEENTHLSQMEFPLKPKAIAVGMGIGMHKETVVALKKLLKQSKIPLVIDADALNILSKNRDLLAWIPKNSILTPHPGELERLIGSWENDYDKIEKAKQFSKEHKCILLVKGAYTMVIHSDEVYINTTGNPGMGTAGSGDVLSGVLAGLQSQGYGSLSAALLGVYLHGLAGDLASEKLGLEAMMASDIVAHIADAYREITQML